MWDFNSGYFFCYQPGDGRTGKNLLALAYAKLTWGRLVHVIPVAAQDATFQSTAANKIVNGYAINPQTQAGEQ